MDEHSEDCFCLACTIDETDEEEQQALEQLRQEEMAEQIEAIWPPSQLG